MLNKKLTEIENESGRFTIDRIGNLVEFKPNNNHSLHYASFVNGLNLYKFKFCLKHLHIPEGVRFIGNNRTKLLGYRYEEFRDTFVLGEITFPDSLLAVMPSAFSGSVINKLRFPKSLKQICVGSFMDSLIYHLDIEKSSFKNQYEPLDEQSLINTPEDMLFVGGRSFKQSVISELRFFCGKDTDIISELILGYEETMRIRIMPEADVAKVSVVHVSG